MPYNEYAVKVIADIMQMPEAAKWAVFCIMNLGGLFFMVQIYVKTGKRVRQETGKDLETVLFTAFAKILFQSFSTGILVSLFGIVSDMPKIRKAETMGMSLFLIGFIILEFLRKNSLLRKLVKKEKDDE